ncbi:MAG TPA: threonine/serine dehydratase [Bryobacteraceae bacterium]|jgi:threonine dehydratase
MAHELLTPDNISRTYRIIQPYIRRTPVVTVSGADFGLAAFPLTFKLELLQHAGSFKSRGAFANLLIRQIPSAGVIAASGGNHGVAVAYAAQKLGIRAKIFVPTVTPAGKLARLRDYGAEVAIGGARYADALAVSEVWAKQSGALPVHAYDQLETLLGQGTTGLEFGQQAPDLDTLLVAVGGGGLIGGIATWFGNRVLRGGLRIIGVEPVAAPTLSKALAAGQPVDAEAGGIAADSLAPRRVGELMFPVAKECVERVILVTDEAIQAAQRALWSVARLAAEPGGAAAFAAVLSASYQPQTNERVGVLVCGGNTDAVNFG